MKTLFSLLIFVFAVFSVALALDTQIIFNDNFEAASTWTLGGDFAIGTSSEGITAHSGTKILATNLAGNHLSGQEFLQSFAFSPEFNVSGLSNISLNFWSKSSFEGAPYDRGAVYVQIDNYAWQAVYVPAYQRETAWTKHYIPLSPMLDNANTLRFLFTYASDQATEYSGWNIDDVVLQASTALGGTYFITPGTSGANNFESFSAAIDAINIAGISAPTTINVGSGLVFTEELPVLIHGGSASNPLTFGKTGNGANPILRSSGNASSRNAILSLQGVNYLSFNGIDLQGIGSAIEYGILLQNRSPFAGSSHNSFSNLRISDINEVNIKSIYDYEPASLSGAHSHNQYTYLTLDGPAAGIFLSSPWFTDFDFYGSSNTIANCSFASNAENILSDYAIKVQKHRLSDIHHNQINHVNYGNGIIHEGSIEGSIHANKISGLIGTDVVGIAVQGAKVFNNFVNLSQSIFIAHNTTGIKILNPGAALIDFNSIRIASGLNSNSACIQTQEMGTVRISNNILANYSSPASTGRSHTLLRVPYPNAFASSGNISNANLFYVANTPNSIAYDMFNNTSLGYLQWQAQSQMDSYSKLGDPRFVSNANLHINPSIATPVESSGRYLFQQDYSWITSDIDGDTRIVNSLDIGADEGDFTLDIQLPFTPFPISPNANAQNVFVNNVPTLRWSIGMDMMHPVDYTELYFSTDATLVNSLDPSVMVQGDGTTIYESYTHNAALEAGQTYYWKVLLFNAVGTTMGDTWSFGTEAIIQSYPHVQGFDSYDMGGWINKWSSMPGTDNMYEFMGSGWQMSQMNQYIHEGASALYINSMMMPAYYWIISPLYELPAIPELSFWLYFDHSTENPTELELWIQSDNIWQPISTWNSTLQNNLYNAAETLTLADFGGEQVRFAFVYNSGAWGNPLAIDSFTINALQGFSLGISQNQDGNVMLSWEAVPGATGYKIMQSDTPYGIYEELIILPPQSLSYAIAMLDGRKFFYVIPLF